MWHIAAWRAAAGNYSQAKPDCHKTGLPEIEQITSYQPLLRLLTERICPQVNVCWNQTEDYFQ